MSCYQGRFEGRTAVITGGASGLGYGVAERILAEGGKVSIWDAGETLPTACERLGGIGPIHGIHVDVSDPDAVEAAAKASAQELGKIDILVCSAGITGATVPVHEFPLDSWKRVVEINLNGLFYCNRAIVPHMLANGYGRIVNVSSVAGKEGNPNASAYSATKAAVIGFTKSLGKELAKTGIRVNCVTPAAVRTAIFDQMSQQHIDFMLSKIPMGRFGTVDEIAALVCWLASEDCSFSTGAVFDLSGGRATY